MRIICDCDEVLADMMPKLIQIYNIRYNSDITIDDIVQWELPQDMKDIYLEPYFFFNLNHIKGAVDGVNQLIRWGHDVVIATNNSGSGEIAKEKVLWIKLHFPKLANNIMVGSRKDLLQGDVIIDDNADYLINSPCPIKICMDRPWNRDIDIVRLSGHFYCVCDWQQILDLFAGGACKIW